MGRVSRLLLYFRAVSLPKKAIGVPLFPESPDPLLKIRAVRTTPRDVRPRNRPPSPDPCPSLPARSSVPPRIAVGLIPTSFATSMARAAASAVISCTNPMVWASGASKMRPVSANSTARRSPTAVGHRPVHQKRPQSQADLRQPELRLPRRHHMAVRHQPNPAAQRRPMRPRHQRLADPRSHGE